MARKSKRLPDLGMIKNEMTTTYNVGIYLRISSEERGSSTSSSIEYQKQLCLEYIKNKQDITRYPVSDCRRTRFALSKNRVLLRFY